MVEKAGRLIVIKSPVTKAMLDKYTEDIAVEGTRIQKELAFIPLYDLNTGWHETIHEMQQAGTL